MGLLDRLWGSLRNTDAQQGGDLPALLLSKLGGGDSHTAQAQGLVTLIDKFQQAGLGDVVKSWVSNQQANKPVTPDQVQTALGQEHVGQLAQQSGMGQTALLSVLAAALPKIVDALTPNGEVPTTPASAPIQQATAGPNQAPGEAEAPRDTGASALRGAVEQTDKTEPTQTEDV